MSNTRKRDENQHFIPDNQFVYKNNGITFYTCPDCKHVDAVLTDADNAAAIAARYADQAVRSTEMFQAMQQEALDIETADSLVALSMQPRSS